MIRSRDNPQVKRWARLVRDGRYRKAERRALVEGPHLVSSLIEHGVREKALMVSESGLGNAEVQALLARAGRDPIVLSDRAFSAIADAETPQGLAAEIDIPSPKAIEGSRVFLEGIQDSGNVGAIIRSAAAFGIRAVVADKACADPWSPKTLRAGMGGHFRLAVLSADDLLREIESFDGTVLCTAAEEGQALGTARLEGALGWIFGSEGRGVSPQLRKLGRKVRIPIAPGTESLNVAAAAAICFYEAFNRPGAGS